jgi:quercetin dioxygenase-like cupin family protein
MKRVTFGLAVLAVSALFVVSVHLNLRAQESDGMILKNSGPADFHPTPIMPKCFLGAMQRINPQTGAAVFLVRVDAPQGCAVPSHWHISGEQITVVSGVVTVKMTDGKKFELKEGGYAYIPAKHIHRFSCSGQCVHFVQSDGPYDIHYVNKDGEEISMADAVKLDQ